MLTRVAAEAEPSATMALTSKAKQLMREGVDVAVFTVGEPDMNTPSNVNQAAHKAIDGGFTKYTDAAGTPELRQAIVRKLSADNGLDYRPEQILVSNGAKHVLYQLMLCLLEEGDEMLLPAPYWVSYAEQARICGAKAVIVDCTDCPGMKPDVERLKQAVTDRTKGLMLNSPSNPTGMVLTRAAIEALVQFAIERGLWIISDEIYEKLIYGNAEHFSPAAVSDVAREQVFTVNGVSKTYAMTGWRIGYAAGPAEVIRAAARLQSNMTSAPNSIAQKAALEALNGPQESVAEMRDIFDQRRLHLVEGLNQLPGVRCAMPQGAFYAFADCRELLGRTFGDMRVDNSLQLCDALLKQAQVAAVPGSAFGAEGYVRFSYATSDQTIEKGLARLMRFLEGA